MSLGLFSRKDCRNQLSSTNIIENRISGVRRISHRVKRWNGGTMVLRWTAAGVLEAERKFRRITGYTAMPKLAAALAAAPMMPLSTAAQTS